MMGIKKIGSKKKVDKIVDQLRFSLNKAKSSKI